MAKEKEKKIGRIMYVEQGKQAKEICPLIGVSEATFSKWVNEFHWKEMRSAALSNPNIRMENIKRLINELAEQRMSLTDDLKVAERGSDAEDIQRIRQNIARIDDGVSKWNKALESIDKDSQTSLSVYLRVMDSIFNALQSFDSKLFMQSLAFQEQHINEIAGKYR